MTDSRAFGPEKARRPHLAKLTTEVGDLRRDVERAFTRSEGKDGYPDLQWVDGGAPAAAGGDMVVKGAGLLQGQSFASLTLFTGTSELVFTAMKPGLDGNDFTVEIQDTGSLTVTLTGNDLVITIDLGTTTSDQIATAVNADAADTDGIIRCASGGTGVAHAVTAATNMTGGLGEGFECFVSGVECLPANTTGTAGAAAVAEDEITVTVPNLTAETDARAAGDLAAIVVNSDGVVSNTMTAVLA